MAAEAVPHGGEARLTVASECGEHFSFARQDSVPLFFPESSLCGGHPFPTASQCQASLFPASFQSRPPLSICASSSMPLESRRPSPSISAASAASASFAPRRLRRVASCACIRPVPSSSLHARPPDAPPSRGEGERFLSAASALPQTEGPRGVGASSVRPTAAPAAREGSTPPSDALSSFCLSPSLSSPSPAASCASPVSPSLAPSVCWSPAQVSSPTPPRPCAAPRPSPSYFAASAPSSAFASSAFAASVALCLEEATTAATPPGAAALQQRNGLETTLRRDAHASASLRLQGGQPGVAAREGARGVRPAEAAEPAKGPGDRESAVAAPQLNSRGEKETRSDAESPTTPRRSAVAVRFVTPTRSFDTSLSGSSSAVDSFGSSSSFATSSSLGSSSSASLASSFVASAASATLACSSSSASSALTPSPGELLRRLNGHLRFLSSLESSTLAALPSRGALTETSPVLTCAPARLGDSALRAERLRLARSAEAVAAATAPGSAPLPPPGSPWRSPSPLSTCSSLFPSSSLPSSLSSCSPSRAEATGVLSLPALSAPPALPDRRARGASVRGGTTAAAAAELQVPEEGEAASRASQIDRAAARSSGVFEQQCDEAERERRERGRGLLDTLEVDVAQGLFEAKPRRRSVESAAAREGSAQRAEVADAASQELLLTGALPQTPRGAAEEEARELGALSTGAERREGDRKETRSGAEPLESETEILEQLYVDFVARRTDQLTRLQAPPACANQARCGGEAWTPKLDAREEGEGADAKNEARRPTALEDTNNPIAREEAEVSTRSASPPHPLPVVAADDDAVPPFAALQTPEQPGASQARAQSPSLLPSAAARARPRPSLSLREERAAPLHGGQQEACRQARAGELHPRGAAAAPLACEASPSPPPRLSPTSLTGASLSGPRCALSSPAGVSSGSRLALQLGAPLPASCLLPAPSPARSPCPLPALLTSRRARSFQAKASDGWASKEDTRDVGSWKAAPVKLAACGEKATSAAQREARLSAAPPSTGAAEWLETHAEVRSLSPSTAWLARAPANPPAAHAPFVSAASAEGHPPLCAAHAARDQTPFPRPSSLARRRHVVLLTPLSASIPLPAFAACFHGCSALPARGPLAEALAPVAPVALRPASSGEDREGEKESDHTQERGARATQRATQAAKAVEAAEAQGAREERGRIEVRDDAEDSDPWTQRRGEEARRREAPFSPQTMREPDRAHLPPCAAAVAAAQDRPPHPPPLVPADAVAARSGGLRSPRGPCESGRASNQQQRTQCVCVSPDSAGAAAGSCACSLRSLPPRASSAAASPELSFRCGSRAGHQSPAAPSLCSQAAASSSPCLGGGPARCRPAVGRASLPACPWAEAPASLPSALPSSSLPSLGRKTASLGHPPLHLPLHLLPPCQLLSAGLGSPASSSAPREAAPRACPPASRREAFREPLAEPRGRAAAQRREMQAAPESEGGIDPRRSAAARPELMRGGAQPRREEAGVQRARRHQKATAAVWSALSEVAPPLPSLSPLDLLKKALLLAPPPTERPGTSHPFAALAPAEKRGLYAEAREESSCESLRSLWRDDDGRE
ncbi:hypothetical protein BESB_081370 [Besnoitia besnoiti]|uniref:Uncharacterized protein n=1 Tax=Besnoitia besnoiti TaxID=94643 RepID=A0A2A9M372_BESBE|nr:hypothetical protein BESB_081370 [Besnoitia besnoiti]PFH32938.1 hypothetical protein BESB_081370 [Besnoitia besnoiti]